MPPDGSEPELVSSDDSGKCHEGPESSDDSSGEDDPNRGLDWDPLNILRKRGPCGCRRKCMQNSVLNTSTYVEHFREIGAAEESGCKFHQDSLLYDLIRSSLASSSSTGKPKWSIAGEEVCRHAFKKYLSIGNHRFDRLLQHAKGGHTLPPRDARHGRLPTLNPKQSQQCGAWFAWCYEKSR